MWEKTEPKAILQRDQREKSVQSLLNKRWILINNICSWFEKVLKFEIDVIFLQFGRKRGLKKRKDLSYQLL